MILKLKIKSNHFTNKKHIVVWIQNQKELKSDIDQVLQFFKENIKIKSIYKFHRFYKITSKNPAIMLSLLNTIQELLTEIYFPSDEDVNLEDYPKI
jgi:hypothetical protein